MNRSAHHVIAAGHEFEVFESAVSVVAVFPPNAPALGNRPVSVFPDLAVHEHPVLVVATRAVFRDVGNLEAQVPVRIEFQRAHGQVIVRHLPWLELRLAHAPHAPAGPALAFVVGRLPGLEPVADACLRQSAALLGMKRCHECRASVDSIALRAVKDFAKRPLELPD